jgi:hypothetical protein
VVVEAAEVVAAAVEHSRPPGIGLPDRYPVQPAFVASLHHERDVGRFDGPR